MITSIIFSKNRACQLDLLLRSLQQNLPGFKQIYTLYQATTPDFQRGYDLLQERFTSNAFIQQIDFQQDTLAILETATCSDDDEPEYICFFVDDNVAYRQSSLDYSDINRVFQEAPNLSCFSLRLGTNTVHHDPYSNLLTPFPDDASRLIRWGRETMFLWDWTKGCRNYSYPFSLDGHIYAIRYILPLLTYDFPNPNCLEGAFPTSLLNGMMACCERSVVVNNPLNLVGSSNNAAGRIHGRTLEDLNHLYLQHKQIKLDIIMHQDIVRSHQEMPIEFEDI